MSCHFLLQCMKVKSEREVAQSCPTLSDPMDCSLPGSSIHGIFPGKSTRVGCHCLLRSLIKGPFNKTRDLLLRNQECVFKEVNPKYLLTMSQFPKFFQGGTKTRKNPLEPPSERKVGCSRLETKAQGSTKAFVVSLSKVIESWSCMHAC